MPYSPSLTLAPLNITNNSAIFNAFEDIGDDAPAVRDRMNGTTLRKRGGDPWTVDNVRCAWHSVRIWGRIQQGGTVPDEWLEEDHFEGWLKAMATARTTSKDQGRYDKAYHMKCLGGHKPTAQELNVLFQGSPLRSGGMSLASIGAAPVNTGPVPATTMANGSAPGVSRATRDDDTGEEEEQDEEERRFQSDQDHDFAEIEILATSADNSAVDDSMPSSEAPSRETPAAQSSSAQDLAARSDLPKQQPTDPAADFTSQAINENSPMEGVSPPGPNIQVEAPAMETPQADPWADTDLEVLINHIRNHGNYTAARCTKTFDRIVGNRPAYDSIYDKKGQSGVRIQMARKRRYETDCLSAFQMYRLQWVRGEVVFYLNKVAAGGRG